MSYPRSLGDDRQLLSAIRSRYRNSRRAARRQASSTQQLLEASEFARDLDTHADAMKAYVSMPAKTRREHILQCSSPALETRQNLLSCHRCAELGAGEGRCSPVLAVGDTQSQVFLFWAASMWWLFTRLEDARQCNGGGLYEDAFATLWLGSQFALAQTQQCSESSTDPVCHDAKSQQGSETEAASTDAELFQSAIIDCENEPIAKWLGDR